MPVVCYIEARAICTMSSIMLFSSPFVYKLLVTILLYQANAHFLIWFATSKHQFWNFSQLLVLHSCLCKLLSIETLIIKSCNKVEQIVAIVIIRKTTRAEHLIACHSSRHEHNLNVWTRVWVMFLISSHSIIQKACTIQINFTPKIDLLGLIEKRVNPPIDMHDKKRRNWKCVTGNVR